MSDRPILFSAPMVRALLEGRKTQTRRILKPVGSLGNGWPMYPQFLNGKRTGDTSKPEFCDLSAENGGVPLYAGNTAICPEDRLWVKETWQGLSFGDYQPTKSSLCEVRYAATDPCADLDAEARGYPWRPSIFMPRWASRLTLIVTDVRVERLQDISEADADAECFAGDYPGEAIPELFPGDREQWSHLSMAECYGRLWDHINGAGAWDENPWVVAYTFTVIKQNIDQIERVAA